jgi:hypothetical protein
MKVLDREERFCKAKNRFATVLMLIALRPQKLALRAQTVCAAGAPFRKEPFAQRRFDFALQNRSSRPFFIAEDACCRQRQLYRDPEDWANEFHVWQGGIWGVQGGAETRR